ncbi:PR domain zinc finger protein 15-like [Saccostrea echinata]|uniref:PR domain zinc finger protein 15-like n=1 Tax=Saccostrea echinata TaxID=191078 RepID=UPI002A83DA35|nr:PR domain zinc finger protein 15-like [Saccostrea echinata]
MEYTWEGCNVCGENHTTECCPELGLLPSEIQNPATTKARLTLPHSMCVVDLGGQEVAVVAQSPINRKTQYGPFEAKKTTHEFNDDSLFLLKVIFRDSIVSLDTTSENECNWLCLVRAATDSNEQNMIAYQMGTSIYYSTIRDIVVGEELKVWYAPPYAKKIGKSVVPDGVSRVMLNMEVIYPSIDEVQESLPLEVPQERPTQGETTLQGNTLANESNLIQSEGGEQELLQMTNNTEKTDREQQTMSVLEQAASASTTETKEPETDVVTERTDLPKHPCQRCEQIFTSENDLAHHLILHITQTEEKRKRGRHPKNHNAVNADGELQENQEDGKEQPAEEDWEELENDDPSDPDFTDASKVAFTVYELSYTDRPRRSMRSRRKIDKDFLYLSNAKKSRKTIERKELSSENSSEETQGSESEDVRKTNEKSQRERGSDNHQGKAKRGRGRPRKYPIKNQENVEKAPYADIHVQPTLMEGEKTKGDAEDEVCDVESSNFKNLSDPKDKAETDVALEQGNENYSAVDHFDSGETKEQPNHVVPSVALLETENVMNSDCTTEEIREMKKVAVSEEIISEGEADNEKTASNCSTSVTKIGDDANESEGNDTQLPGDQQCEPEENMNTTKQKIELEMDVDEIMEPLTNIDDKAVMSEMKRIKALQKLSSKYKHVCKHCGKHFKSIHYLKLHIPMHTGKFSCKFCGFNFARKDSMLKHDCKMKKVIKLLEKDGKDIFQCLLCLIEMEDIKEAREHYLSHKKDLRCINCNEVFGKQQLLRDHICPNASEKPIKCDICKHPFPSQKSLMRHLAIHTNIFQCPNCLKTFARKDSQLKHILVCCPERAEEYKVYACSKCRKGFATKLGLDNHEAQCQQEFCDNCNKVFDSVDMLRIHQETCKQVINYVKKDKVLFSCGLCKKSFRNLNYLNRHKEMHRDQLECNICKKIFKAPSDLDDHVRFCVANSIISEKGSAACEICGTFFYSTKAFREHYQTHTHPYSCDRCKKRFIKIGTLHTHQCLQDTSLMECHHCQQKFPGQTALKAHIKKEHRRTIQCKVCLKNFLAYKEYETHTCVDEFGNPAEFVAERDMNLLGDKPICHVCGKEFTTTSNLNKHVKIHGEKKVECEHCGKKFHHEEYLKVHVEGVHEKKHKFQCEECGKFLTSKPGLVSHMKQFHSDEKVVYPCSECGKVFNQKGNRKIHMFSHMKEKLFKCDECDKMFKYPEQLKKHRFIHSAGEKLKCESCDKLFPKQADLEKHMQTAHSGLMYVCNICNSRCAHKHTLLRHYKRKHPEYIISREDGFVNSLVQRVDIGEEAPVVAYSYVNDAISVPMETVTIEENTLPQVAAEALKSLSSTMVTGDQQILSANGIQTLTSADIINVPSIDGSFQIQNLVHDPNNPDDQQTVVILQIVNPENEQGVVTEEVEVIGNVVDLPEVKDTDQGQFVALT